MPAAFMPEDDLIKPPLAAQVTKTDFGVAREPNFPTGCALCTGRSLPANCWNAQQMLQASGSWQAKQSIRCPTLLSCVIDK